MAAWYSAVLAVANETPAIPRSVALKALERIAERWNLKRRQIPDLVGRPARTVRDWFDRDRGALEPDVNERISHLVGIYDGLHRLFGDGDYADRWIHEPNAAFAGHPPRDLLLSGRFTALVEVRRYIEQALSH
jgi:uncharacterized protein (DUF2384 family)